MTEPLLLLLLMVAAFAALAMGAKVPLGLSLALAALAGALAGGSGFAVRHLVEGAFGFFDIILIIATAMVFMKSLQASGLLDGLTAAILRTFHGRPVALLWMVTALLMLPGHDHRLLAGRGPEHRPAHRPRPDQARPQARAGRRLRRLGRRAGDDRPARQHPGHDHGRRCRHALRRLDRAAPAHHGPPGLDRAARARPRPHPPRRQGGLPGPASRVRRPALRLPDLPAARPGPRPAGPAEPAPAGCGGHGPARRLHAGQPGRRRLRPPLLLS